MGQNRALSSTSRSHAGQRLVTTSAVPTLVMTCATAFPHPEQKRAFSGSGRWHVAHVVSMALDIDFPDLAQ
jgi:hypothetical protein